MRLDIILITQMYMMLCYLKFHYTSIRDIILYIKLIEINRSCPSIYQVVNIYLIHPRRFQQIIKMLSVSPLVLCFTNVTSCNIFNFLFIWILLQIHSSTASWKYLPFDMNIFMKETFSLNILRYISYDSCNISCL